MIELYFSFLGEHAMRAVYFYREHALVLNVLVVVCGVFFTIAHRNTLTVEALLRDRYSTNDMRTVVRELQETPLGTEDLQDIKRALKFPLISSTWHILFYTITHENIVKVLRRKYGGHTLS